jgi:hypothetical protein
VQRVEYGRCEASFEPALSAQRELGDSAIVLMEHIQATPGDGTMVSLHVRAAMMKARAKERV